MIIFCNYYYDVILLFILYYIIIIIKIKEQSKERSIAQQQKANSYKKNFFCPSYKDAKFITKRIEANRENETH